MQLGNELLTYELTQSFKFNAAHCLPGYPGDCSQLHGHTWKLNVTISGDVNPDTGMLLDFKKFKLIVEDSIIKQFDHKYLNDILDNPTAENIGIYCWSILYNEFKKVSCKLTELSVYESDSSRFKLTINPIVHIK